MRNAPLAAHAETTAFPPLTCRTWRKIGLHFASDFVSLSRVPEKPKPKRRSGCPVSVSLEILGDRWSLLIIRDVMVRGFRTFKDFEQSGEGIATNILADRLQKLITHGIITTKCDPWDGRKLIYSLTPKGIDLAPVLTEMVLWAGRHEKTENQALIRIMQKDKQKFIAEIRRRWAYETASSKSK